MSFFTNPLRSIYNFVRPPTHTEEHLRTDQKISKSKPHHLKRSAIDAFPEDNISTAVAPNKKQRIQHGLPADQQRFFEKMPEETTYMPEPQAASVSPVKTVNTDMDRSLMPPPATPKHAKLLRRLPRDSLVMDDNVSQATRSTRITRGEVSDEYNMEEARRRAAATQLPPNSGVWEPGERELFFHLAYRGFEPLIPNNWMIDFPTLPLSVFAHQEDDEPLIKCHRSTEFRAIKALRELMDTGTAIRDRKFANYNLRSEPVVDIAIKRYLKWAFQDLNLPTKSSENGSVPVHTIVTMRPKQNTENVLLQLSKRMHTLAQHHGQLLHVHKSIETADNITPPDSAQNENGINADSPPDDLPVIYGIMICSSIVALFTLNRHMSPPPFFLPEMEALSLEDEPVEGSSSSLDINTDNPDYQGDEQDAEPGIRYIAQFDFSDAAADVWNAFVVVIAAMQIRKSMALSIKSRASMLNREMEQGLELQAADESWLSNLEIEDGHGLDHEE